MQSDRDEIARRHIVQVDDTVDELDRISSLDRISDLVELLLQHPDPTCHHLPRWTKAIRPDLPCSLHKFVDLLPLPRRHAAPPLRFMTVLTRLLIASRTKSEIVSSLPFSRTALVSDSRSVGVIATCSLYDLGSKPSG